MNTQKIILVVAGAVVIVGLGFFVIRSNNNVADVGTPDELPSQLCFYKESTTDRGFKDVTSLKVDIDMDKISGELKNLPAEKDSKVGTFEGLLVETNERARERTANVWWNTLGEGMQVKEELLIKLSKDANGNVSSAQIGFGEMVDRGDGVYVYKDENNLSYVIVPKTNCATFPPTGAPTGSQAGKAAQFGKAVTLSVNEKIAYSDGLNVTLKGINDSRCPKDVQCIWSGELAAALSATQGNFKTNSETITIGTVRNTKVTSHGYDFSLKDATTTSATIVVELKK